MLISRPPTGTLAPDAEHPHWHYLEPRLPASLPGSGRASGRSGHNTAPRASSRHPPPPPTPFPFLLPDFQVLSSTFVRPPVRPRARENDARTKSERKRGRERYREREEGGENKDVRFPWSKERLIFPQTTASFKRSWEVALNGRRREERSTRWWKIPLRSDVIDQVLPPPDTPPPQPIRKLPRTPRTNQRPPESAADQ